MAPRSLALVGTAGGAGTTRLAVELAAACARGGRRALVLDIDFDRQGLAGRVPGRLAPDSTALLTDPDASLADAVHDAGLDAPGRVDLCPAHAPFTRVADAKTPTAAERLADRLAEAETRYDAVLIDTPPVASNPAVAAVTAADRVALVTTPDERGVDAVQRARGRLADVGTSADAVVATRTTPTDAPPDVDVAIPTVPNDGPGDGPDVLGDGPFATALVGAAETLLETDLGIDLQPPGRLDAVRKRLS